MAAFWNNIVKFIEKYFSIASISVIDIMEMLILAFLFYKLIIWMKHSRAWSLLKGIIFLLIIALIAAIFQMSTIQWLAKNLFGVGIIALIIIFQPEFRKALEHIGKRNALSKFIKGNKSRNILSPSAVREIVSAVEIMSEEKTGALICIEREAALDEYAETGLTLDSVITRQLLLNIFEDKTPLHDGAVIIKDERIKAATCYLPLSEDQSISKRYGTRHRAALGLSEVTDAFIIVVSEETGDISIAEEGRIRKIKNTEKLLETLMALSEASTKEAVQE